MTIRINNIKLPLNHNDQDLKNAIEKKLRTPFKKIKSWEIIRRSADARRKDRIIFLYHVEVNIPGNEEQIVQKVKDNDVMMAKPPKLRPEFQPGPKKMKHRPLIIGAGPSGTFAALELARRGYRPIVIERGRDVEQRNKDILSFWRTGELNVNSNVQYGEGGAGTFSDGKLTTRISDSRIDDVFKTLVEAGAPEEIMYDYRPHIGTDKLRTVAYNLRQKLIALGGEMRFEAVVTDVLIENGEIKGVIINNEEQIDADVVIIAIGHSSRDTYEMLYERGVLIMGKPLAIGARIEHPQSVIDTAQYGDAAGNKALGAADYTLVKKAGETVDNRACYSFCMCPGGVVVSAASEEGMVVTNGMSYYSRASRVANSALVATVTTDDFKGDHPLAGVKYLRKFERKAYELGGGGYVAPAQKVGDFLEGRPSNELDTSFRPTYRPGIKPTDLHDCLPEYVSKSLEQAVMFFGRKLKGYNREDAILTGVETRTSAPVRIPRGDDFQSLNTEGLYPAGEGAGYAGGIVSASVDGLRVAEHVMATYNRPL